MEKFGSTVPIDTLSLGSFWKTFQNDIQTGNKQKVIESLDFPIHALYPVLFRYAYDCDTLAYIKNEKKYADFDIDRNNIADYYDFVFGKVLKQIINKTSVEDLLAKGFRNEDIPGITYIFYPKDYMKVECSNDHNLKFFIHYRDSSWRIGIGGL